MIYIWTYVSLISSFHRISSLVAASSVCTRSHLSSSWFLPSRARPQSKLTLRQLRSALAQWLSALVPQLLCARSSLGKKLPWSMSMTSSVPWSNHAWSLPSPPKIPFRISGSFCSIAPSESWCTSHLEIPKFHEGKSLTPEEGWRVWSQGRRGCSGSSWCVWARIPKDLHARRLHHWMLTDSAYAVADEENGTFSWCEGTCWALQLLLAVFQHWRLVYKINIKSFAKFTQITYFFFESFEVTISDSSS